MCISMRSFAQGAVPQQPAPRAIEVYVFLSETCPICQSYTLTLKKLYKKYHSKNVVFIAVYPEEDANADSISAFQRKYNIAEFKSIPDRNAGLARELAATITPEVVVRAPDGSFAYRGRIDDTFVAPGKRRNVITSNDLDDALAALVAGKPVKQPETKAVGCIISTVSE